MRSMVEARATLGPWKPGYWELRVLCMPQKCDRLIRDIVGSHLSCAGVVDVGR